MACALQRGVQLMAHVTGPLVVPEIPRIQEVVLRGARADGERYQRMRSVIYLRRELRCPQIWMRPQVDLPEVAIWLYDWQNPAANVLNFDRLLQSVGSGGPFRLVLRTKDWLFGTQAALEVLNRYQRMLPVVRKQQLPELLETTADAVDIWRWLVRLKPTAGGAVQLAALRGRDSARRRAQSSDGLRLLRDATDVSFFATRSWDYLRTWGREQTQANVERRLGRMSEAAICCALATRQPAAIASMIDSFLDLQQAIAALPRFAIALP